MSEQDGTQSSTKQRRSRKTNIALQENGKQAPAVYRPTTDDTEAWKDYWETQGQPWRTEPEIDEERQKYLTECHSIKPDWKQGIYPLKNIKLSRADVEWLLTTHENGRGPLDWNDGKQRARSGLDLRGADLSFIDLHSLPLTRLKGALTAQEWREATEEQRNAAAVRMDGTDLRWTHLERADLRWTHLERADLSWGMLEGVRFRSAHLEGAKLFGAHLEGAYLGDAYLKGADFRRAHLEGANFQGATLSDEKHVGPLTADGGLMSISHS